MPDIHTPTPDTMFPALDGQSSAEQSGPADITGLVLKDLAEPRTGRPPVEGESISVVPESVTEGAAAPPPEKIAEEDLGVRPSKKGRTFQDRIDRLTRRNYETKEENSALTAQIQELTNTVRLLTSHTSRPAAPTAPQNSGDLGDLLAGGGQGSAQGVPAAPSADLDVSKIVEEAIGRYDQKQRQAFAQVDQLRQAHETSFAEASDEFPELRDQRTVARQTFNKLFDNSPLKGLPDAPYQIALQVRGILAGEASRKPTVDVAERKRLASTLIPTPSGIDSSGPVNRTVLQAELDKSYAQMRSGVSDFALHKKVQTLRELIRRSK